MKLLFAALFITIVSHSANVLLPAQTKQAKTEYVYICDSKSSYAYHSNYNCRGLQRCKHGIIKTTKDSAINYYHRQPCRICN